MNKLFALLLALLLGKHSASPVPVPVITPTPTPVPQTSPMIGDYTYRYIKVATSSAITLIPNFRDKKDVQSLMTTYHCASAVNGGFYTKTNTPLGYFRIDEKIYASKSASELVNGYYWIDDRENSVIASELPYIPLRIALQTGPMLMFNQRPADLAINNDAHARRMIAAKTSDGGTVFMAVYNPDSVYDGPLLSDMPDLIEKIDAASHTDIADAINLDGGSASSFYSGETQLSELTPVGSLFCIQ